eukprot:TRINITY_DN2940_c0_g1_i1.p1 TRINITY_DN2940_c0_g1~~TRINITY_DN2940_c0_g1_i1.p1  ORF type:complete len:286 (-),score=78.61 TRINITY_DN2940_c0_g1_i1:232-1041(-)
MSSTFVAAAASSTSTSSSTFSSSSSASSCSSSVSSSTSSIDAKTSVSSSTIACQYDQIGSTYISAQDSFFSSRADFAEEFLRKQVSQLVKNGGKMVLDLGCGSGSDILAYEKLGAEAYGVDASKFMIEQAKNVLKHPERVVVAAVDKVTFSDRTFDGVVSRHGFHYQANWDHGYSEAYRVLKSKGLLALIVPNPEFDAKAMGKKLGSEFIVERPLFNGKVIVRYPHCSNYFTDFFKKHFKLISYTPYFQSEVEKESIPSAAALLAERID